MPGADWVERVVDVFGEYDEGFGPLTVHVPADAWPESATQARDRLGCTYFDWLSAVDELAAGFGVLCHLAAIPTRSAMSAQGTDATPDPSRREGRWVDHLLLRTSVPRDKPELASIMPVFPGAGWHERETSEMFGISFVGGPSTARHLLLPEEFEGHPLRKDFVLASRVAKPWPGAKEPGESDHGGGAPSRRRTRPPGAPDPEAWGPREPGSPAPDPLAAAAPGPTRPRRSPRGRPEEVSDG